MTPLQALEYLYQEASVGTLDNSKNTECLILLKSLITLYPLYKEAYEILKRNLHVQMPLDDRMRLQEIEEQL